MAKNPFQISGYEGPETFCDRVAETEKLTRLLINGNNVVLMSPRRMGKTGLLHHCFQQEAIQNEYNTFIIDIYSTKNVDELVFAMGKSILNGLKSKGKMAIEKFLNVVSSLKSSVTFDIYGNPAWNLEIGALPSPSFTMDQIFEYISKSSVPCIVAIDEFQQILYYPEKNVEAILRTYIQNCRNAVFVFSGSEQHLLSEMFSSPARPFYASTSFLPLDCIPLDTYREFVKMQFMNNGKNIDGEVVDNVYERFEGITWFMQKVMNYLYTDTEKNDTCTLERVDDAVDEIVADSNIIFSDLLYQLTSRQKELLVAINKEGKATAITGSKFIKKYHLPSASTIQTTIKALQDKQIVVGRLGVYEVYDKFLALWLGKVMS